MNEFKPLENIFTSFLGEPKSYMSSSSQQQFCCPCCAEAAGVESDGKYNLEINYAKGKFRCWKCGETNHMHGGLSYLIKRYGNKLIMRQYLDAIQDLKNSGFYNLHQFTGDTAVVNEDIFVKLPKTFKKVDYSINKKGKMVEYLKSRKITQEIIDKYNIGYTTWDEEKPSERNRIIFPSYDADGFLNYWVGRDYTGYKNRTKYKNVDDVKKESIVFFENLIEWDADIILTEGPFDAINLPNAVPLLGKTLSRDSLLYQRLYRKANANIIIAIDSDTEMSEVKRIYKTLNQGRLKGKIRYIRPENGKDFGQIYEESGKEGIIKQLKHQYTFTELELLI
jgi:hypothetical protein